MLVIDRSRNIRVLRSLTVYPVHDHANSRGVAFEGFPDQNIRDRFNFLPRRAVYAVVNLFQFGCQNFPEKPLIGLSA